MGQKTLVASSSPERIYKYYSTNMHTLFNLTSYKEKKKRKKYGNLE